MGKTTGSNKDSAEGWIGKCIIFISTGLSIVLFIVLVLFIFNDCMDILVRKLLDNGDKTEIIKLLGWMMGGALAAVGVVVLNRRAEAQVEDNRLVEKGYAQERIKAATEHLGHDKDSVRIAAFYEFVKLANDNKDGCRESILEILDAHVRTIASDFANREGVKNAKNEGKSMKLTEEIYTVLDVLFKSKGIDRSDIKPNLQRVYLPRADLVGANLVGVNLTEAELPRIDLTRAKLPGAILTKAILFRAKLLRADLTGAILTEVDLFRADLTGADLSGADLSDADLFRANLTGAKFPRAILTKANLTKADLAGADLSDADLSDADLSKAQLGGAFYTNKSRFPDWIVLPIMLSDNDGKVQFPEGFIAPEKPKHGE